MRSQKYRKYAWQCAIYNSDVSFNLLSELINRVNLLYLRKQRKIPTIHESKITVSFVYVKTAILYFVKLAPRVTIRTRSQRMWLSK